MQKRIILPTVKESNNFFKKIIIDKENIITKSNMKAGELYFFNYDAKNKDVVWDKKPFIFMLKVSKRHFLGINFHWAPAPLRIVLIKFFLNLNRKNIRDNKELEMNYEKIKPMLKKLGFSPIIRKYIRSGVKGKVVKIPPSDFLYAAMARTEAFTNGISAEELYKKAIAGNKKYRKTRKRRE